MDQKLTPLRATDFDYAQHLENIWKDSPYHWKRSIRKLQRNCSTDLDQHAREKGGPSPLGWVIAGPAGTGKTHLLGVLRRKVWASGGWFILFDFLDVKDFWLIAALSYLHSLQQKMPDGRTSIRSNSDRAHSRGHRRCSTTGIRQSSWPEPIPMNLSTWLTTWRRY